MKFAMYQDGKLIDEADIPSWVSFNYLDTVNGRLEFHGGEPVDKNKMAISLGTRVVRVAWIDGERNDAQYSMLATFIGD